MRKHGKISMHERDEADESAVDQMLAALPSWVKFDRRPTAKRICEELVNAGYRKGEKQ